MRSGLVVDPLLVDAMALPLKAHRKVLKVMGLDTQDAQTDALVQLQKTLLDQRQNHARRAREHAINTARASGATVDEPLHAMMRDSHSIEQYTPEADGRATCHACHPRDKSCTAVASLMRCSKCGACSAAAAKHYCPFMSDQEKWRMRPGRVDRAEATATTQLFVRHDGCWLGCRHTGGTCFGGTVVQVQPEEVTVQQQREADAERGQIRDWGLEVRVLVEAAEWTAGDWLTLLGVDDAPTLEAVQVRLSELGSAVQGLDAMGVLVAGSGNGQPWIDSYGMGGGQMVKDLGVLGRFCVRQVLDRRVQATALDADPGLSRSRWWHAHDRLTQMHALRALHIDKMRQDIARWKVAKYGPVEGWTAQQMQDVAAASAGCEARYRVEFHRWSSIRAEEQQTGEVGAAAAEAAGLFLGGMEGQLAEAMEAAAMAGAVTGAEGQGMSVGGGTDMVVHQPQNRAEKRRRQQHMRGRRKRQLSRVD